jgi:hypothetical protein
VVVPAGHYWLLSESLRGKILCREVSVARLLKKKTHSLILKKSGYYHCHHGR